MSDGTPFLRVAADRIGAPGSPAKCHSAPPTPQIGPQSSGPARRWLSFEGELRVERFRVTLNGLGGYHMGNPGLRDSIPPCQICTLRSEPGGRRHGCKSQHSVRAIGDKRDSLSDREVIHWYNQHS